MPVANIGIERGARAPLDHAVAANFPAFDDTNTGEVVWRDVGILVYAKALEFAADRIACTVVTKRADEPYIWSEGVTAGEADKSIEDIAADVRFAACFGERFKQPVFAIGPDGLFGTRFVVVVNLASSKK